MFLYQAGVIVVISALYCFQIVQFCKRFIQDRNLPRLLMFPIIIFSSGYLLRLSGNKQIIDVGYFLTDSSSLFLYALFTGALILGQVKFWKK